MSWWLWSRIFDCNAKEVMMSMVCVRIIVICNIDAECAETIRKLINRWWKSVCKHKTNERSRFHIINIAVVQRRWWVSSSNSCCFDLQLIAHWIDWMLQQFHNQKTWKQKEWNCDHFRHHMGMCTLQKPAHIPKSIDPDELPCKDVFTESIKHVGKVLWVWCNAVGVSSTLKFFFVICPNLWFQPAECV